MILGAHESIAGGVAKAFERAEADGAKSLQVFTKNARGWAAKPLSTEEAEAFRAEARRTGIPALAHCTYLVNLATEDPVLREKSLAAFADELSRCHALGIPHLVVHPGAHPDLAKGSALVAQALDACFAAAKGASTGVLLEITAGQGTSIGHRFEQLAGIVEKSSNPGRLGVCLDTCHLFAAGYDLATAAGYQRTMEDLEASLGAASVKAVHLNDCKKPLGCRVDRHEEIGEGMLGLETFRRLLEDPRFEKVPGVLETPSPERYRESLEKLRSLVAGKPATARRKR